MLPAFATLKPVESLDSRIIKGLFWEQQKRYLQAYQLFLKLYDETDLVDFLYRATTDAIMADAIDSNLTRRLHRIKEISNSDPKYHRIMLTLYMATARFDEAKKSASALLELSDELFDKELASQVYVGMGEYDKAYRIIETIYEANPNMQILLKLTSLLELQGKEDEAIRLIETHRRIKGNDPYLLQQLASYYAKKGDIDGLIGVYESFYRLNPSKEILERVVSLYLMKANLQGAADFLERIQGHDALKYEIFKAAKRFAKAYEIAERLAQKENDPAWYAELAILTYELAADKNDIKILSVMSELFEKALRGGVDDPHYLNYYGYTLIDKGLQVDKGVKLVKMALEKEPDNSYYLDSLAWGYYKKKRCKEAYELMKRVVEKEGLEIPEVKEHWEAIKRCYKR